MTQAQDPWLVPRLLKLKDGRDYLLRPLRPDDEDRLQAFFASHSPETVYERYGHMVGTMTRKRAHELVTVDQARDPALVLTGTGADGGEIFHAIARYYLEDGGASAEFAVVVQEDKRRLGIAALMLRRLMDIARARGVARFWGQVLPGNHAMIRLCRKLGMRAGASGGGALVLEAAL